MGREICGYFKGALTNQSFGHCVIMDAPTNCQGQILVCPEIVTVLNEPELLQVIPTQHTQTSNQSD